MDPSISVRIGRGRIYKTNYVYARIKIAFPSQIRTLMSSESLSKKTEVMDMSFLFGANPAKKPEKTEEKSVQKIEQKPVVKTEIKAEEKPVETTKEINITVEAVSSAVVDGNTVYYIKATDGKIYTVGIDVSPNLPFVKTGDVIKAIIFIENNLIKPIN